MNLQELIAGRACAAGFTAATVSAKTEVIAQQQKALRCADVIAQMGELEAGEFNMMPAIDEDGNRAQMQMIRIEQ